MSEESPLASLAHEAGEFSVRSLGGGVHALEWTGRQEVLRIEPWGPNSLRVRSKVGGPILEGLPGALLDPPDVSADATVEITDRAATIVNGGVTARVGITGRITFLSTEDGSELLAEQDAHFWWPGPRLRTAHGNGYARLEQRFTAYPDEKLYGLGQHQHGLYDQKGAVVELVQRNSEVTIPFLVSSRGYGFLWNNPAIGRVELALNGTRWVADSARQLDYWIVSGDPAQIQRTYADVTGHVPMLPEWAAGFWQCKLRYRSQEELLEVAREYHRRGIPLDVIVADFFHWTHLGEWRFDPAEWPDPDAAVAELASYGTKLMVSVWPSVSPLSEYHTEMERRGFLIGTEFGPVAHADWPDKGVDHTVQVAFYDATNPRARDFVWSKVRESYLDRGIEIFWADACEPELKPGYPANLRYHAGPGLEVGNMYPRENSRMFYEGMHAAGKPDVVTLNRSAWAGSQRYGAILWSGDIHTDFATFRKQIAAGLNTALSGMPWWNTDIGGFHGGNPESPEYREVMVRWFQFGAFSPIFRLHGFREPATPFSPQVTGGPNEIWSYGEEACDIMAWYIALRERIKPYVLSVMQEAHETGLTPMRPYLVEFPEDAKSWTVDDAYLFGRDLLVAPVLEAGARSRDVYLPKGASWRDAWTGEEHEGGQTVTVPAPLDRIPLFLRDGASLPIGPADGS
ncbi:glycoside hydrolase family 31 protein [Actinospica sp.]|uniref:glycoside hydrolase family 31 protein n=1 Tax=Actinospica sp. TaxID=1872142 RepID=UPI002B7E9CB1|nr:glycoside hydrolase family 31 protein [Actinospica sp.]HWG26847.1 glycoside hydrolase family 31 protein [Actinospica sp.]